MAVKSLKSNFWDNPDGLRVEFPGDAGVVTRGGEYQQDGRHWTDVEIDLTALPTVASGNQQMVGENLSIPKGAYIEEVHLFVSKAATSGGSATFDLGFVATDRSTEYDFNGLVAALAKTALTPIGSLVKITVGSTGAGAILGLKTTQIGYLTANANTADFTAGKIDVRVFWTPRVTADD